MGAWGLWVGDGGLWVGDGRRCGSVMVVCGSVMVDRGSVMVVCGSAMEDRGCYGGGCLWVGDVVYRSVMVVFGFRFAEYRQRIRGGAT